MDPFLIFGLDYDVTDDQVTNRYHELVRRYPPDRAPDQFAAVRKAYEALKDERTRIDTELFYFDHSGQGFLDARLWDSDQSERRVPPVAELQEMIGEMAKSTSALQGLVEQED